MTGEGDQLPPDSRVVRYVPFGKMRTDEDENFLGPLPSAFERRVGEDYLSVSWCEYFEGTFDEQLRCSIESIRNSKMSVKPKACFCVADTRDLLPCIENFGGIGRAVYHPEDDSHAHAGVYGVGAEELELLSYLADEVWNTYLTKQDADNLPLSACGKSPDVA